MTGKHTGGGGGKHAAGNGGGSKSNGTGKHAAKGAFTTAKDTGYVGRRRNNDDSK